MFSCAFELEKNDILPPKISKCLVIITHKWECLQSRCKAVHNSAYRCKAAHGVRPLITALIDVRPLIKALIDVMPLITALVHASQPRTLFWYQGICLQTRKFEFSKCLVIITHKWECLQSRCKAVHNSAYRCKAAHGVRPLITALIDVRPLIKALIDVMPLITALVHASQPRTLFWYQGICLQTRKFDFSRVNLPCNLESQQIGCMIYVSFRVRWGKTTETLVKNFLFRLTFEISANSQLIMLGCRCIFHWVVQRRTGCLPPHWPL